MLETYHSFSAKSRNNSNYYYYYYYYYYILFYLFICKPHCGTNLVGLTTYKRLHTWVSIGRLQVQ